MVIKGAPINQLVDKFILGHQWLDDTYMWKRSYPQILIF